MPFFSGCCEKRCRDNTLTVIGFFKDPDFRGKFQEYSWPVMEVKQKLPCDISKNKCRLCGGTAERKKLLF